MDLDEKLKYQSYEHAFVENDILTLKNEEELKQVKDFLYKEWEGNLDALSDIGWYLTPQKQIKLNNKKLKVINSISWHMGIPFYIVETDKGKEQFSLAEFFLQKI